MEAPEILRAYPNLETEDIREALHFAAGSRSQAVGPAACFLCANLGFSIPNLKF
jgi:hypothetical protein